MVAISTAFTPLTYAFGSLLTSTKMTQLMDNTTFNNEWIGASYVGAAVQDHDHDGINSKQVVSVAAGSIGQTEMAANAVGQAELKDALQQSTGSGNTNLNFTGGTYTLGWGLSAAGVYKVTTHSSGGYQAGIRVQEGSGTFYVQARYFTASEPYNLGNGDIPLFVFVVIDSSGNIVMSDVAEAPPWFYNGRPENTFNPKKYKRKPKITDQKSGKVLTWEKNYFYDRPLIPNKITDFEEYKAFLDMPIKDRPFEEIEITPEVKNLDMDIIPHPFSGNDLTGKSVVLLDPVGVMAEKMRSLYDMGESVNDLLHDGYLLIDNEDVDANSPTGVKTHKVKWKV